MRTVLASLVWASLVWASLAGALTLASAAPGAETQGAQVVSLPGYYVLDFYPYWVSSDKKPWHLLKKAPWADPLLIKYGYVAATHDEKHYYCLIQSEPPVGTRIGGPTYICGDPATAEMLYTMNWKPIILTYGAAPH